MLFLRFITPLLLLTSSVAAREVRARVRKPWGEGILASLLSTITSTPTTATTSAPPTIAYPKPTTPLDNRKYTRTIAKYSTVETPATTPLPLTPIRTAAPLAIEYAKSKEPRVKRPEVAPGERTPRAQSATPTPQAVTKIVVYRETRSASKPLGPTAMLAPLTARTNTKASLPSDKPGFNPTLCQPCVDAMKSCMRESKFASLNAVGANDMQVERVGAGAAIDDATYKKCLRELCFFDGEWPGRCKADGRCGVVFNCPVSEVLLRD